MKHGMKGGLPTWFAGPGGVRGLHRAKAAHKFRSTKFSTCTGTKFSNVCVYTRSVPLQLCTRRTSRESTRVREYSILYSSRQNPMLGWRRPRRRISKNRHGRGTHGGTAMGTAMGTAVFCSLYSIEYLLQYSCTVY
jgi:hypothetical protein